MLKPSNRVLSIILLWLTAASAPWTQPSSITGRVVKVTDGDTITILTTGNQRTNVRLANIDAPERKQPWGNQSRLALADWIAEKVVRVDVVDVDRYQRLIGLVYYGTRQINSAMVANGHAWVYPRYNRDPTLPVLQSSARRARQGLWALSASERLTPWVWRNKLRDLNQ